MQECCTCTNRLKCIYDLWPLWPWSVSSKTLWLGPIKFCNITFKEKISKVLLTLVKNMGNILTTANKLCFFKISSTVFNSWDSSCKDMWIQSLWFFACTDDSPPIYVEQLLKHINDNNVLPPLMVLEILSRSRTITLGVVKVRQITHEYHVHCIFKGIIPLWDCRIICWTGWKMKLMKSVLEKSKLLSIRKKLKKTKVSSKI